MDGDLEGCDLGVASYQKAEECQAFCRDAAPGAINAPKSRHKAF